MQKRPSDLTDLRRTLLIGLLDWYMSTLLTFKKTDRQVGDDPFYLTG
jgi:hypothetical protein